MKNDQGYITTKYIEYKSKNTRTSSLSPFTYPSYSVLIHLQNDEKPYH